jgi:hypothetical protein
MKQQTRRVSLAVAGLTGVALVLAGCDTGNTSASQAETNNENVTGQIESAANHKVPFPTSQVTGGGFTEEQEIKEHQLREGDSNETRYVTVMTPYGQVLWNGAIKGLVFDPNSSMTETTDVVCNTGDTSSAYACGTVNSPTDNGTYGPEFGMADFFDTSGAEHIYSGVIIAESDVQQNITQQPIVTYNVGQAPAINYGGVSKIGGK